MAEGVLNRYRAHRAKRSLSIRSAASEIGISFSVLAGLERGEYSLTPKTERAIRRWLGEHVPFSADEMEFVPVPVNIAHAKAMIAVATDYLERSKPNG